MNILKERGSGVLELIDQLQDMWASETGNMEFNFMDFNLEILIDGLIAKGVLPLAGKEVKAVYHYDPGCSAWCNSDPGRIGQILGCLAKTMRYKEIGVINVSVLVFKSREEDVMLKIRIEDTGPGLKHPEEANMTLPLVQSLVERMGGSIAINPGDIQGNISVVILPVRTPHHQREGSGGRVKECGQN
jgi:signal transduction histidine kinase